MGKENKRERKTKEERALMTSALDFHQKENKLATPPKKDGPSRTHVPGDQNPDQNKRASSTPKTRKDHVPEKEELNR